MLLVGALKSLEFLWYGALVHLNPQLLRVIGPFDTALLPIISLFNIPCKRSYNSFAQMDQAMACVAWSSCAQKSHRLIHKFLVIY